MKIEENENISCDNQCLVFESKELTKDSNTLYQYDIGQQSVILFFYRSKGGVNIFIRNEYNIFLLNVNLSDRIENIKEMIIEKKNIFVFSKI